MRRFTLGAWALAALVASLALAAGGDKDPMFVRWLAPTDAGDQTIRVYWEQAERGQLGPQGLVDLGTMLFHRGYPKDAVRYFRRALDQDPALYEAWFRIGLVEHREGNLRDAEEAYRRCLKLLTGHGWCNFYMGLLKEQSGHPDDAMDYYRRAFKFAPELSDPKVNPELLYSQLHLGAQLLTLERGRFGRSAPMPYLEPEHVSEVRGQFEKTPVAAAEASAAEASAAEAATAGATGGGATKGPAATIDRGSAVAPAVGRGGAAPPAVTPVTRPQRPGRSVPVEPGPDGGAIPPRLSPASPEASLHPSWAPWG